ncbi:MAG: cytochrome c biogenesis protein CcdA [Trueperaceae bacterium]
MRASRAQRAAVFVALAGLAASAAVVGALLTGTGSGALIVGVESLSSSSSALLDRAATLLLPLGFAFGAGMVSAANPCGFAMLPAFLALFLSGTSEKKESPIGRIRRALLVSAAVTAGFVLLFGIVGLTISAGARSLAGSFPWLGFATGALLILAGAWLAAGGTIYASLGERLSSPLARVGGDGPRRYFTFGLAYGLASLSCTLPVFLAVLGSTLTLATLPGAVLQLALYGLGMGAVIALLTLSIALFQNALVNRIRRAVPYIAPVSSALLLLAGSYIVYYWLTVGALLSAFTARG